MIPVQTPRPRAPRLSALDFKVGVRILARYPWLTVVGTISVAVAIALGSTYFEAVNKWRNPTLPIDEADRVVAIQNWDAEAATRESRMLHDFATWRTSVRTINALGAAILFERNLTTEDGVIEPVAGAEITANAFALMGTAPLVGRTLIPRDEQSSEPPVLVIAHAVWKGRFASDSAVIGRTVSLGTMHATIVGVMPEGFGFPVNQRVWTALRADGALLAPRTGPAVTVFGRLAAGATLDDAQAELAVLGARAAASAPETHRHLRPLVSPYAKPIDAGEMLVVRNIVYIINVIFVLLLAIVCTNVASLMYARAATRGWEITVRSALGASRARIVAQMFIEALVLVGVGTTVGLLVAKLGLRFGVARFATSNVLPFWIDATISWTTVAYAVLLTFFGAAIVGILPALRVTRVNIQDALRNEGAARSSLRFGGFWTAIIVAQVAITVAFLSIAAGGVFESNRFNQRAEGIGGDRFLTASVAVDREEYGLDSAATAARARASFDALERRLLEEPGVEHVTFADRLPVEDQFKYQIELDTLAGAPTTGIRRSTLVHVARGFFRTFGTSVVAGRDFAPLDFETGHILIVNQSFARHVLGERNPIGQRVRIVAGEDSRATGDQWYEVVGMVRDFGWQLPLPHEQAAMYRPRLAGQGTSMSLAVRVSDPDEFAGRLRAVAAAADPTIRLTDVQRLSSAGGGEARINWTLTAIVSLVGGIVLLLSATGIHALMSFTVTRRTREIGIRAALGASQGRIAYGILGRAVLQIGLGVVVGSALAALRGIGSPRELIILVAADAVMLVVGLAACAVPLRRALRIDPTEALRAEG
jgi:predicted permease